MWFDWFRQVEREQTLPLRQKNETEGINQSVSYIIINTEIMQTTGMTWQQQQQQNKQKWQFSSVRTLRVFQTQNV